MTLETREKPLGEKSSIPFLRSYPGSVRLHALSARLETKASKKSHRRFLVLCQPLRKTARMEYQKKLAVDIREAAQMCSVSPRTIQNYIRAKQLPARKLGRRTVIEISALEKFLRTDHPSAGSDK